MKNSYFAVYDKKSQMFSQAFPSHTPGSAERSLRDSMANAESPHARYPDDFALYHLFDLDDESGYVVATHEPPLLVCEASALISN